MTAIDGTTRSRSISRHSRQLVVAMCALVVTDLVGGLLAVAAEVNTWAEAWWTEALLAAPFPMIVVQVVLTLVAVTSTRWFASLAAALLTLACLVSVVSGFFDGGLGNDALTPGLSAYQVFLLVVTAAAGALAARRAVETLR